jgi:adenylate cyclase
MLAVQVVVQTFNFFVEGRQKRFIKDAFGTYLSPDLVDEVTKSPDMLSLTGEEKELTILFSDIRNFTSISERLGAKELSTFLNEYLTPMTEIVMETHGTVDKFIGDAVMAFWGAPIDLPDHAARATRAGLKMMEVLEKKQPEWQARGLPLIDIGIGINTGRVSVGNMGSTHRFDYTVMGDSVNLASRLEGQNKNYGTHVLTSEATRSALGDAFFCRRLDCIRVKGKQEGVWIYEVICEGEPNSEIRAEVETFEAILEHYQHRRFDKAKELLSPLIESNVTPLYSMYRERIEGYLKTPPPESWDGIYTLTTK